MKRSLFTVIGLTTFILPGIASAQNAVTEWNSIAVTTALAGNSVIPPNSPNGIALYLGYVHLAIHDAVNAIEHKYKPYGPAITAPAGASVEAAVAAASYYTLQFHFPNQSATLAAQYNASLAAISNSGKTDGVTAGRVGRGESAHRDTSERWAWRERAVHLPCRADARRMDSDSAGFCPPDHTMDGPDGAVHDAQCISVLSRAAALALEHGMGGRLQPGEGPGRSQQYCANTPANGDSSLLDREHERAVFASVAQPGRGARTGPCRNGPLVCTYLDQFCGRVDRVLEREISVQLLAAGHRHSQR
jgi:hypothetical protein